MDTPESQTRTTNLPLLHSKPQENLTRGTKTEAVSAILSRLALHYWRPDFDQGQFRNLLGDFLDDLKAYQPAQISAACDAYRRSGEKFFPTPGQLLKFIKADSPSRPRLETYKPPQIEGRQATKTVGQVLRDHGMEDAAIRWESKFGIGDGHV